MVHTTFVRCTRYHQTRPAGGFDQLGCLPLRARCKHDALLGTKPSMDLVAAMTLVTAQAAEVEPVVDILVKAHVEFEIRKGRYKKALDK